jgi:hypothetical protein
MVAPPAHAAEDTTAAGAEAKSLRERFTFHLPQDQDEDQLNLFSLTVCEFLTNSTLH